ncbi:heterokaryon incompatibility protein-domain-containing protein, partial [Daedaleopsis nitida]
MRLVNTRTGEFLLASSPTEVKYAVLSHVWSKDGEQLYQDVRALQSTTPESEQTTDLDLESIALLGASPKIRGACARALADGFDYIWMDFCCIDKTSSAKVSDAVNSMYSWYSQSAMCYVYLDDVSDDDQPYEAESQFRASRWHTRMWTLPELLAPKHLTFLSANWKSLGTKQGLAKVIEEITGIASEVVTHAIPLTSASVARRMSWASRRATTRKEDEAYALMGLFGVNMPVMYGEGALAFIRLQEEILKILPDQTIFAWRMS